MYGQWPPDLAHSIQPGGDTDRTQAAGDAPMLPTAKQAALCVGGSASARQAIRGPSSFPSRSTASELGAAEGAAGTLGLP